MKASLCLEYIGDGCAGMEKLLSGFINIASNGANPGCKMAEARRPWVAEITGFCPKFGLKRKFLKPTTQRQRSSSTANRGSERWFVCEDGRVYQAQHFTSWKSKDRFFFIVTQDGKIERVSEEWARNLLELMSSQPQGSE